MKVELHLHTSRHSACAVDSPERMVRALIEAGYGAVFLTEHDAVWQPDRLAELQGRFPEIGIFGGVELTLGEIYAEHLLVLGTSDREYVRLAGEPAAVLEKAREEGCLTVLAHPFRWQRRVPLLEDGLRPDALEYRTGNQNAPDQLRRAADEAARRGLKLVNAGDVHSLEMINRYWTETDRPVATRRSIRPIILDGAYRRCAADE